MEAVNQREALVLGKLSNFFSDYIPVNAFESFSQKLALLKHGMV